MNIVLIFGVIFIMLVLAVLAALVGYNFRVYETKEFKKKPTVYKNVEAYDKLSEDDKQLFLDKMYYGSNFEKDFKQRSRQLLVRDEIEKMEAGAKIQEEKNRIMAGMVANGSIDKMAKNTLGIDIDDEFSKMTSHSDIDIAEGV